MNATTEDDEDIDDVVCGRCPDDATTFCSACEEWTCAACSCACLELDEIVS
jgi:hypothetical protein